jgi:hypothetical protein
LLSFRTKKAPQYPIFKPLSLPDFQIGDVSAMIERQAETEADFMYSILCNAISIVDLNLGNRSVTNDIENVFAED